MLPLLNYEQNISFLCRFMQLSPCSENFPPGSRRGREESCKQKCSAAGGGWGLWTGVIHSSVISFFIYRIVPSGGYPGSGCLFTALYGCFQHSSCRYLPYSGQRVSASRKVQTVHYKQFIYLAFLFTRFSSLIGSTYSTL